CWVAAHLKLTTRVVNQLMVALNAGLSLEAAARAVEVSSKAIRKRAARDPLFAARLRAARRPAPQTDPLAPDWMQSALWLGREAGENWSGALGPNARGYDRACW